MSASANLYNLGGLSLTGTRLGPYEVTAQIGVGGMGEVYRATDTNLRRAVAIKVLPASVSGDPDRLARFQREAEVLAALNHPNIAQIVGGGVDNSQGRQYDVTRDGRFLINTVLDDATATPITLIQNWAGGRR